MDTIKKHLEKLGHLATDKVTGYKGMVDSVSFDAYGCIQLSLKPPMNKDGEMPSGYWFDTTRCEVTSKKRVIPLPDFERGYVAEGLKGPADKPAR